MKIAIIHLDLGIGGAERLVVNIALCLKRMGHDVRILTSHHDPKHCFEETAPGGIYLFTFLSHLYFLIYIYIFSSFSINVHRIVT
jgi:hypothetical protein